MAKNFDHSMKPVPATYPQISAAVREIAGEITRRINQRAAALTEIWKSSVSCTVCGEDHEPLPPAIWPHIRNKAGRFVKASSQSISAAGDAAFESRHGAILASDIWNQPGENAYPASAFVYTIVRRDLDRLKSAEEARTLAAFLGWVVAGGQSLAAEMDYASLTSSTQAKALEAIRTLRYQGKPVGTTP